jgi:peptidoglycan hydrolase CwlO-like protein
MARDLAALKQTVEQLEVKQEQLVRDNENLASQLKASREEVAHNNSIINQIKATQIQMARESQTLTERLNASQEQLARVIANASEPKAMPGAPKVMPEEPKVSPEEPKAMREIPLPRPRQSANVAQTQKPARPQAKKPQPSSAWPWSVR